MNELQNMNYSIESQIRTPAFTMPYQHSHRFLEIYYLKKGHCIYSVNNSYFSLLPGNIMIVAADEKHNTSYDEHGISERIVLFVNMNAILEQLVPHLPGIKELISKSQKIVLDQETVKVFEYILEQIAKEQNHPGKCPDYLESLLICQLFVLIMNHGFISHDEVISVKEMEPDIEKALSIIGSEYASPLTLEDLASRIGLNSSYLSRKFSIITGKTYKEHLTNVRLRNASRMLITTDDSVTSIALACGFSSSNYFKDIFHKEFHCSPREYRNSVGFSSKNKPSRF